MQELEMFLSQTFQSFRSGVKGTVNGSGMADLDSQVRK